MSFLAPLFLLGGLAIGLPVLFHLVRRSSRERMVFSSLMFLRATPPRMTRRNRLEHVLLLLLRCLAIGILSLGFARPFFQKPIAAAPASGAGAQVLVLVDTSASMKREGLWPAAMASAETALKRTTAADRVAACTFDDRVRTVVSFEQWGAMNISDRAALAFQRLSEHQPSWRSTHLGNALIAAAEVLEEEDRREPHRGPRRVVLITDLQEGSRLDGLQGHDWPRGLEVVVEPIKAKRPTNAGLQWVLDAEDSDRAATQAVARLRVGNSTDANREQFQVRWAGVAGAATLEAYVPPGQSRVLSVPKLSANLSHDRLALSGDDDDFDNVVYLVQPKADEVQVLFLGDDLENDPAQLLYYLKRAFQDTRRQTVALRNVSSASPLPKLTAPTSRMVIVAGALAKDRADNVRQFVSEGGTVLLVMNDAASANTLGQLTGNSDLKATEAVVANYSMFGQMDFDHPLLAPFSDPRFSDFTKIRFWKHRRLPLDKLPVARAIARFDDHDPAVLEVPVVRGRVFVFTFSWRPAESQFALSSKFVPLLYSLLDQAGGGGVTAQLAQYGVGAAVDLSATAGKSSGRALAVRKPDGSQVQLAADQTRFTQTDQPGIYEVLEAQSPVRFAVNLDASESQTAPLAVGELERLGVPLKSAGLKPAPVVAQQSLHNTELEARQKLWRGLIVAALGVLLLETWLAGWITRRSAVRVESAA